MFLLAARHSGFRLVSLGVFNVNCNHLLFCELLGCLASEDQRLAAIPKGASRQADKRSYLVGLQLWSMAADPVARTSIDGHAKEKAAKVLADMGSVSDSIRLLLVRLGAEEALPFEIEVPSAEIRVEWQSSREAHPPVRASPSSWPI